LTYLEVARWGDTVTCLKCGSARVSKFKSNETERERFSKRTVEIRVVKVPARLLYECNQKGCRHQFTATTGTIFADTHLPLTTWFKAIGLILNAKKGISALQMQRDLGCHYRTVWHLNHRIREAMQDGQGSLFGGVVEVEMPHS
jgi:hypothetical protein